MCACTYCHLVVSGSVSRSNTARGRVKLGLSEPKDSVMASGDRTNSRDAGKTWRENFDTNVIATHCIISIDRIYTV